MLPQSVDIPGTCAAHRDREELEGHDNGAGHIGGATFKITPNPAPGASGGSLTVKDNDTNDADPRDGYLLVETGRAGRPTADRGDGRARPVTSSPTPATYGPKQVGARRHHLVRLRPPPQVEARSPSTRPPSGECGTRLSTPSIARPVAEPGGESNIDGTATQNVPAGTDATFGYGVTVTAGRADQVGIPGLGRRRRSPTRTRCRSPRRCPTRPTTPPAASRGRTPPRGAAGIQAIMPASATTSYPYACACAASLPANTPSGAPNHAHRHLGPRDPTRRRRGRPAPAPPRAFPRRCRLHGQRRDGQDGSRSRTPENPVVRPGPRPGPPVRSPRRGPTARRLPGGRGGLHGLPEHRDAVLERQRPHPDQPRRRRRSVWVRT